MRLISGQPPYPPRACAKTNRIDGDFIDFQVVIDRPEPTRLYLKRELVEQAARELLGMVDGGRVAELERDLAVLAERIEELQHSLTLAAEFEDAFSERTVHV